MRTATRIEFRLTGELLELIDAAAERAGMSRSEWCRRQLFAAARQTEPDGRGRTLRQKLLELLEEDERTALVPHAPAASVPPDVRRRDPLQLRPELDPNIKPVPERTPSIICSCYHAIEEHMAGGCTHTNVLGGCGCRWDGRR